MSFAPTVPESSDTPTPPTKIPEMRYHEISLNGTTFELALVWQLSWLSLACSLLPYIAYSAAHMIE